jgi:tripartite ATP-independent transporter DctM subunit
MGAAAVPRGGMMGWVAALGMMLGVLSLLLLTGLPVAFSFIAVNFVGAGVFLGGDAGLAQVVRNAMASLTNFTLAPIPLFILMGEILLHTGVAFRAVDAIERMMAKVPGRLPIVSVVGGTIFAALSGSTMANTAMLGSTLLPEMLRRGYHPSIAMGPIMATGGIAMLIPPSALAVLLGSLANISIAALLVAGIIPGLLMSLLFVGYIVARCVLQPEIAPRGEASGARGWTRWRPFLVYVAPLFAIFVVVIGSLLAGIASPTESAALGCVAAALAAAGYRSLGLAALLTSLRETAKVTVMILFIIVASVTFSQILAFSGATNGFVQLVETMGVTPFATLCGMMLILLALGCFVDQVSMVMVTVPFFIPLAKSFGIDLVWLGTIYLLTMEIGFLTPPFGLLLFVMKGVAPPQCSLGDIYRAAAPFIALELTVLGLLMFFPQLGTWLPSLIAG